MFTLLLGLERAENESTLTMMKTALFGVALQKQARVLIMFFFDGHIEKIERATSDAYLTND